MCLRPPTRNRFAERQEVEPTPWSFAIRRRMLRRSYYDPLVVFVAPRPGFNVIGAIRFGYGIHIGVAFSSWGGGTTSFGWSTNAVIVNGAPWARTWTNRAVYVHPYPAVVRYRAVGRPPEIHTVHERTARERAAER